MRTVTCPICRKEDISLDTVDHCPICGFDLKNYEFDTNNIVDNTSDKPDIINFYSCIDGRKVTFSNGLKSGASGNYTYYDRFHLNYHVEDDQLIIEGKDGYVTYTITPNFLLNNKRKYKGKVADHGFFNAKLECNDEKLGKHIRTFNEKGHYGEEYSLLSTGRIRAGGFYKRTHDLIVYHNRPGDTHMGLVVYNNSLYDASYVSQNKVEELEELFAEIDAFMKTEPSMLGGNNEQEIRCIYCKSPNVKKIKTVGRMMSVGLFGLGSSKIGKQWHCNSCGSDF